MRPYLIFALAFVCSAQYAVAAADVRTFGEDVAHLREHTSVIILSAGDAQVALAPDYQGRVMTSTSAGADGPSYGWINRELISSGKRAPHMNAFGGEDRFWLGPEGGQFSIFFKPGDPFDFAHWQTPPPIDWGPWAVVDQQAMSARFRQAMKLVNYSGTKFLLDVERSVRLHKDVPALLGLRPLERTRVVGYESQNTITNTGAVAWRKDTGLLSIWILGMFTPSPRTTIVVPYVQGAETTHGSIVNDMYFGKVPSERLHVESDVMFFRGDGEYRSKIGISRKRALPIVGSYDADSGVLTLVRYTLPDEASDYVNSLWEIQQQPYAGDVINSYNDGPPQPGAAPLGPFYELETSSPAAELAPGERLTHVHETFHFQGPADELDMIARATLNVSLERIIAAFKP